MMPNERSYRFGRDDIFPGSTTEQTMAIRIHNLPHCVRQRTAVAPSSANKVEISSTVLY
jgi:hypothetical protein